MNTDDAPAQPAPGSGQVNAAAGRWNEAALLRIRQKGDFVLTWTAGTLGVSVSIGGTVIGRINKHGHGRPFTASIQGFELWHEPTRIIRHWHYTPSWAVTTLREAKLQVERVIRSIPSLDQET